NRRAGGAGRGPSSRSSLRSYLSVTSEMSIAQRTAFERWRACRVAQSAPTGFEVTRKFPGPLPAVLVLFLREDLTFVWLGALGSVRPERSDGVRSDQEVSWTSSRSSGSLPKRRSHLRVAWSARQRTPGALQRGS